MKEDYIDKGNFIGNFLRDIAFKFSDRKAFFGTLGMDDIVSHKLLLYIWIVDIKALNTKNEI